MKDADEVGEGAKPGCGLYWTLALASSNGGSGV